MFIQFKSTNWADLYLKKINCSEQTGCCTQSGDCYNLSSNTTFYLTFKKHFTPPCWAPLTPTMRTVHLWFDGSFHLLTLFLKNKLQSWLQILVIICGVAILKRHALAAGHKHYGSEFSQALICRRMPQSPLMILNTQTTPSCSYTPKDKTI